MYDFKQALQLHIFYIIYLMDQCILFPVIICNFKLTDSWYLSIVVAQTIDRNSRFFCQQIDFNATERWRWSSMSLLQNRLFINGSMFVNRTTVSSDSRSAHKLYRNQRQWFINGLLFELSSQFGMFRFRSNECDRLSLLELNYKMLVTSC